jgi:hypothetical protein
MVPKRRFEVVTCENPLEMDAELSKGELKLEVVSH